MKYVATILLTLFLINGTLFAQRTPVFDSSFALNGVGRYPLKFHSSEEEEAVTILLQPDGKMISVVNHWRYGDIMVKRISEDGSIDSSFGENGYFLLRDGLYSSATSAVLSGDGKIIITARITSILYPGFYIIRLNSNGKLDSSFNEDGRVMVFVRDSSENFANGLTLQPDGKIVIAGSSRRNGIDTSFAVVRLNSNGSLDESFGQLGKVIIRPDSAYKNVANAVAIQNNKIVVTGSSYRKNSFSGWSSNDIAVLRLNFDGTIDSSFDGDGEFFFTYDNFSDDEGSKIAIQDDNKIIVAGTGGTYLDYLVIRLNNNGSLDKSFGEDGKKLILRRDYSDYVKELKILPGGKILIGGTSTNDDDYQFSLTYLLQLNNDGSDDMTFGEDGIILYAKSVIGTLADFAVKPDQKLWLFCDVLTLASLNNDGSIDSSFNNDGKIKLPYFESNSYAQDVAIMPDGKMVIAGFDDPPPSQTSDRHIAVLRLNKDGSPDSSFNNNGSVVLSEVNTMISGWVIKAAVQKDDKIVVITDGYSAVRLNKNGSIDSSFGENGKVQILNYIGSNYPYQLCAGLAIQEDGKILIAGNIINVNQTSRSDYYVVRLNTDGSYDKNFSKDGKRTIRINGAYRNAVNSMAISTNNTIIVSGISYTSPTSQSYEGSFSAIKLKSDGSLDSSFGKNGVFLDTMASGMQGRGATMALDNSGRILMLGSTLFDSLGNSHLYIIRLKSNAEFDSSFGNNGVVNLSYILFQILPQANGKILLGGFYNTYDCYLQQLLENGTVDNSFAQNGGYIVPTPNYRESFSMALTNDLEGKIVLATTSQFDQPGNTFGVIRLLPADIVLATKLININARLVNKDAIISWQTANEISTAYFNVQRSLDGRYFYTVAKINATGNNADSYSFKDLNVIAIGKQIIYYRLQQFDKDGNYVYSKIVSVTINENGKPAFSVYPNPAKQKLTIIPLNLRTESNKVQVRIIDMSGKIVYTVSNASITASGMDINVAMLTNGMYILAVSSDDKITKLKFLKE